jgi:hypothetical protein
MAFKFQLHFERAGGELRLCSTSFWADASAGKPTSVMNSESAHVPDQPVFRWHSSVRALCVLILRAFASDDPVQHPGLRETHGRLARGPVEALGDKHAKDKPTEPTWIQTMFLGYDAAKEAIARRSDPRLPASLLTRSGNNDTDTFFVHLGRDWKDAQLGVFVDGFRLPQPPQKDAARKYNELADELERALRAPLQLEVYVAPPGAQQLSDFRLLTSGVPPVHGNDQLRIHVRCRRRAFLYLCWITPKGQAEPIYPWDPPRWDRRAVGEEEKQMDLTLPLSKLAWKFEKTPGLETLLVLARKQPLTKVDEANFRDGLSSLPKSSPGRSIPPGPFELDLLAQAAPAGSRPIHGRPQAGLKLNYGGDDPVSQRHAALAASLRAGFRAARCLSFLNEA